MAIMGFIGRQDSFRRPGAGRLSGQAGKDGKRGGEGVGLLRRFAPAIPGPAGPSSHKAAYRAVFRVFGVKGRAQ